VSGREALEAVRADRWLWAARVYKTRALAAAACAGGKVEVNDHTAKAARPLRPGDLVRVTVPGGKRVVRIVALSERRGPAGEARALYEDLTPPAPPRTRVAPPAYRQPGAGRPTKRERRLIDRLRVQA
jgi:ribosome-associated heat shock protein Hsp15